ncbi:MAG: hypothetical protein N0C90_16395, partial [Candidatus Thiodiazotropha endolucinida]|nr:hypothetical protein [Candidatus Thiodiazotropha taylori]MCW4262936.1 hypothetical protein [Candidatus Thiodiazotropha endolucinida]
MSDNERQNDLLSKMEQLISTKLNGFEQRIESTQRHLSQSQISVIQTQLSASDTYTFRKKGNEEQFKVNSQVLEKMK